MASGRLRGLTTIILTLTFGQKATALEEQQELPKK